MMEPGISQAGFSAEFSHEGEFYDDVSGLPLKTDLVCKARKLEMKYFVDKAVYTKRSRAWAKHSGHKFIDRKWIDVNKGDDQQPDYRPRLVARELKGHDERPDLFAGTPPVESLRYVISSCATTKNKVQEQHVLMINDVRKAYFYAVARRTLCIEIPEEDLEDGDEEKVGVLNLSMYGTRDAAQNWSEEYAEQLRKIGFLQGKASACHFLHVARNIKTTVHGGDFLSEGPPSQLKWMRAKLETFYDIKTEVI